MTMLMLIIATALAGPLFAQADGLPEAVAKARELRMKTLEERLAEQIPDLDDDSIEKREAAESEIARLALSDRARGQAWLRAEVDKRRGERSETTGRLRSALRRLPAFALTLKLKEDAKVAEPLALETLMTNLTDASAALVDYRENCELIVSYPLYRLTVEGASGPVVVDADEEEYCQPLHNHHFKELAPGESRDPFIESRPRLLTDWKPSLPGIYRARLVVDFKEKGAAPFAACDECEGLDDALLDAVPDQRYEAELTFEVLP